MTVPGRRKLKLVAVVVVGLWAANAAAQTSVQVVPAESKVAIDGRSNVNKFTCVAARVEGSGEIVGRTQASESRGKVEIPVEAFDCRNDRMNKDLFDALKGDEHPFIAYRLEDVRVVDEALENGAALLEAEGTIWVAGVGRSIRTRVVGDRLANGYLRAAGTLDLSMSDFNIEPPSAVLGLVRVHEEITVRFEITAAPDMSLSDEESGSRTQLSTYLGVIAR